MSPYSSWRTGCAKLALAIEANSQFWEKPAEDLGWDQRIQRRLIEAVCSIAGFKAPRDTFEAQHSLAVVSDKQSA